jgi:hypothetical protein
MKDIQSNTQEFRISSQTQTIFIVVNDDAAGQ